MRASIAGIPVALGLTVLGAGVLLARGLLALLARLLPGDTGDRRPQHHVGRVRAQVLAAEQAARQAGVLGERAGPRRD